MIHDFHDQEIKILNAVDQMRDIIDKLENKCNKLMSQHKADIEKLQNQNLDLINENGKLSDELEIALVSKKTWENSVTKHKPYIEELESKLQKAEKVIDEQKTLLKKMEKRWATVKNARI